MLKVPSWKKPLGRVTDRVAGGFAVTCGILALGTASATSASAQASPDDHPTCPNCVIQFDLVTTVGSLDGPGWIPGRPRSAARDNRGRLYLTYSRTDHVLVFDSTGQPLPPVGRSGEGPGEYQNAYLVEVGRSDTVMVFDFTRQLSFVAPSGQFVRRSHAPVYAVDLVLTGDGSVVLSATPPAAVGDAEVTILHVFSPDEGEVERSFHTYEIKGGGFAPRFYLASAQEPDRFWTAFRSNDRYEVVQYAINGTLTRQFGRSPAWMRRLPSEDGFPAPSANIYGISEADGRLWIVGQHPVEDWTLYLNREINRELEAREIDEAKLYRSVVEVVETETGRLVSSASVPGLVVTLLPDQHVATYREDEAGVPFLDVFRMTVSRPGDDWPSAACGTSSSRARASCS